MKNVRFQGIFQKKFSHAILYGTIAKSSEYPCFPVVFRSDRNGSPELSEAGDRRADRSDGKADRHHGR